MPIETAAPRVLVSSRYDLRGYRGLNLFKQGSGGSSVSAPAWSGQAGIFRDVIEMIVAHGTEYSLGDDLADQWADNGGSALSGPLTINSAGKVLVTNDCGDGDDLVLVASADNAVWGLPTVETTIADGETLEGGDYQHGFTGTLGSTPPYLTFKRNAGGANLIVPSAPAHFSDVRLSLRTRGSVSDVDDGGLTPASQCLEALDNGATDPTDNGPPVVRNRRVRWAILTDSPVRIVRMVPQSATFAHHSLVWQADELRQLLGASGSETLETTGATARDIRYQVFELAPLGVLTSSYARDSIRPSSSVQRRSQRVRDGRQFMHQHHRDDIWRLQLRVEGPADVQDLHLDVARQTWGMLTEGYACLFHRWGESRRVRRARAGGESSLYTTARDGYRGREYVVVDDDGIDIDWASSLMTSASVQLRLRVVKQETSAT